MERLGASVGGGGITGALVETHARACSPSSAFSPFSPPSRWPRCPILPQETVSVWVPGLQIIAARVAKPRIPEQLQGDFVRVEEETSKLKVANAMLA